MSKYDCKKENYTIIPLVCTVDISTQKDVNQGYASACISLPCRQCRSCISPPCLTCRSRVNLEQIEKIEIEKLFSELLAA